MILWGATSVASGLVRSVRSVGCGLTGQKTATETPARLRVALVERSTGKQKELGRRSEVGSKALTVLFVDHGVGVQRPPAMRRPEPNWPL